MLDRNEENTLAGNRGMSVQKLKIGAKSDGTLTAIDLYVLYNMGAYGVWADAVAGPAKELYNCPNVRTHILGVRVNLGTHAAFRAPGYTEGTFALESGVEELSEKLGISSMEFRRKNHADTDQTSSEDYTSKHLLECYDKALEQIGLQTFPHASLSPPMAPGSAASASPARSGAEVVALPPMSLCASTPMAQ